MSNKPSFFAELKRRNVYKVAVAYAVVGWLIMQVAATIVPALHLPDSLTTAVVVVVLLGFPIALVIAWAFEMTPEGMKRTENVLPDEHIPQWSRRKFIAFILVVGLIAAALLGWQLLRSRSASSPTGASAKSIAVLPFENLSSEKENEYFASGMQDMILTKLAEIHELKVLSRTSTAKYKSHPDDLKSIAQQLGVAHILEGSVQKSGNQVLINLQLIDAATDEHVWAQAYTRTLDNVFGVEGEVAQTVAKALKARLSPGEIAQIARMPTENKAAYDLFLRAIYYLDQANRTLDRVDLNRSIDSARQAIALDPNFAEAFCLLALDYTKLGGHLAEEEAAARRALALAPDEACGHKHMAFVLQRKGDLPAAIEEAQKAVRLKPTDAGLHSGLGFVLLYAGRFDEAAAAFLRAAELSPNDNFFPGAASSAELAQRRYDRARSLLQIPVARDPTDINVATLVASTLRLGWGDLSGARKVLEGVPTSVAESGALSTAWFEQDLLARDYAAALHVIEQAPAAWFESEHTPRALYLGRAYQAQGDDRRARDALASARTQIEDWLKTPGDDARLEAALHAHRGLALAGLGENDAALREAQRAVSLMPVSRNAVFGPPKLVALAKVLAQTGHAAEAIAQLHALLEMPAGADLSVPLLKLDPVWDSLRKDPSFQKLLEIKAP